MLMVSNDFIANQTMNFCKAFDSLKDPPLFYGNFISRVFPED